jgi:hypothetical protein
MFASRNVAGALLALGLMSLSAAPAKACCGWFGKCCGASTAYYPPVVANYQPACAPACSPCGGGCAPYAASYAPACNSCQTVNYAPQTCYRTVYYSAPVVAYSPVAACGPCGQTTVMRPVTTYVTQARVVPYTMYRPMVAAMPVSAPVTAAYYAPAPAPVIPAAMPLGTPGTTVPSLAPAAAAPAPAPSLPPASAPAATEQPNPTFETPAPDPQSRIVLPPRSDSSTSAPRALDPEDRMTALPLRQAWSVRNASMITPAKPEAPQQDDGGWRAAR